MAAWEELERSLRHANKFFLNRADGGRAAAFQQLSAINRFIAEVTKNDRLLQMPLFALNVALYYLDLGIVEPMLSPKNRARRGRRPEQGLLKIRAAVAMSQLFAVGYDRGEAAKRVAKELARLGISTSAHAVADWRDHFTGLPENDQNGQIYRQILQEENKALGRDTNADRVVEHKRPEFARRIMDAFRKFVLLARLTRNPNLSKVLPQVLRLRGDSSDSENRTFLSESNSASLREREEQFRIGFH